MGGRADKDVNRVDLSALAQSGATAIVGAMASDAWDLVRTRIARLFGPTDVARERSTADQLEAARQVLTTAPEGERDEVTRQVQRELLGLLEDRLRDGPQLVEPFGALIIELRDGLAAPTETTVWQNAKASKGGTIYQAGRDIHSGQ